MILRARMSRRRFLVTAIGVGAPAVLARFRPWRILVAFAPLTAAERLAGLLTHQESARVVGRAYLDRVPEEAFVSRLVDRVVGGLPAGRRTVRGATQAELRELLAARIRADFEGGRVVDVGGWVLSPTEARLYALSTLV